MPPTAPRTPRVAPTRSPHYLRNGDVFELTARDGGCHGPSNFERASRSLAGASKRHYTRDEIEQLSTQTDLDIVMTHDAPRGITAGTALHVRVSL